MSIRLIWNFSNSSMEKMDCLILSVRSKKVDLTATEQSESEENEALSLPAIACIFLLSYFKLK